MSSKNFKIRISGEGRDGFFKNEYIYLTFYCDARRPSIERFKLDVISRCENRINVEESKAPKVYWIDKRGDKISLNENMDFLFFIDNEHRKGSSEIHFDF